MSALLLLLGYLLGSIPTGLLVGRAMKGIDLRTVGSGNIGAANAFRNLGPIGGLLTLLGDLGKGLVPVVLVRFGPLAVHGTLLATALWQVGVGLAAIEGHNHSIFLGGKGGKGIATSLGVTIALNWQAALCCAVGYGLSMALTRYASVSSLCGSLVLPFAMYFCTPHGTADEKQAVGVYVAFATLATGMAFYKHRKNLANLRAGTEPRLFSRPS